MKPRSLQRLLQSAIVLLLLIPLLPIALLPIEDSATVIVTLICAGVGIGIISLVRDAEERRVMLLIFCAAYGLRIVFTSLFYALGLVHVLGGEDDTGWTTGWALSRFWRGWLPNVPTLKNVPGQASLPETFLDLFATARTGNLGYPFIIGKMLYYLDVPSQMAIAMFNGFINSATAVMVYSVSRRFFSQRAALIAAGAAVILPGYLAWSALTIKETWVIFAEFSIFFLLIKWRMDNKPLYGLLIPLAAAWLYTLRYYVALLLVLSIVLGALALTSKRPFRTVGFGLGIGLGGLMLGMAFGVLPFDPLAFFSERLGEFSNFREGVSQNTTRYATRSAVRLDYDVSTPGGFLMMVLVGSLYLLLSPFPWQVVSGRQIFALPDVLLWWTLVFAFILPGIRYSLRYRANLLAAVASFALPLIILYSLLFGNVGLAYRQRAQIMPFLLVLAAAGAEERIRRKAGIASIPSPMQTSASQILERWRNGTNLPRAIAASSADIRRAE